VALLEKRRFLYNHSGDFPQVILIVPSHVPNSVKGMPQKNTLDDVAYTCMLSYPIVVSHLSFNFLRLLLL
jgi:hypothetical protein